MQRSSGPASEEQLPPGGRAEETAQNWGFVIGTFVLFFTGLPGVLARASVYTACVVIGHCSLRQSPSELAVALRSIGQDGHIASSGVPFLEVSQLQAAMLISLEACVSLRKLLQLFFLTVAMFASIA